MYTYERVRARNFVRTWGFVQCSQAIPIAIGVPISGINYFYFFFLWKKLEGVGKINNFFYIKIGIKFKKKNY